MRPQVKFCGMTQLKDILSAEELNVDFIGFVFETSSSRHVTLKQAQNLRRAIQYAKMVGVFTDHSLEEIEEYAERLKLDYIQLHGEPDLMRVQQLSKPVIQAFCGVPQVSEAEQFLQHCPYILIDKADGENEADFAAIAKLPTFIRSKLFLAGSLTPGNVRPAVDRIQSFAVDCARGVESEPGHKNENRMFAFFQALS